MLESSSQPGSTSLVVCKVVGWEEQLCCPGRFSGFETMASHLVLLFDFAWFRWENGEVLGKCGMMPSLGLVSMGIWVWRH